MGNSPLAHPYHLSRAHSRAGVKHHTGTPGLCPGRRNRIQSWAWWPLATDLGRVGELSACQVPRQQDIDCEGAVTEWGRWWQVTKVWWLTNCTGLGIWRVEAHPARTCAGRFANPDKMGDRSSKGKAETKKWPSMGKGRGGLLLPYFLPPSQHLSSTHFFPEFLSQKTLQNTATMERETAYPHKSPGVSGLQRISRLNVSWKWQLFFKQT